MADLTRFDDRQLMARQRAGDGRAREILIERYLPLARSLALRYRRTPEPMEDLMQIASLGLVKAVDGWEPERGLALSSYAVPTILGELRRYFRDRTWAVRPPRRLLELVPEIERSRDRLTAGTGREPTPEELAADLRRPREEILDALSAARGRWTTALEGTADEQAAVAAPDRGYDEAEATATFERLVSALDPRAREVVRLCFRDGLPQSEIGRQVGTSQIQVSRILRRSLEQLALSVRQTALGPQLAGSDASAS
jgi:RNA polymerase sigma-B factor